MRSDKILILHTLGWNDINLILILIKRSMPYTYTSIGNAQRMK